MDRSEQWPGSDPGEEVGEVEGGVGLVRKVCVELGCGQTKLPGFIGLDRFPLPCVDVVADLDEPLPFADDSVDLVYASHSLEHVRDLSRVMREVHRICRHGAQICIVAPYYQQALNLANPYHYHAFNEHTPRFWTSAARTPIDPSEYAHPHAHAWGLLESDNSAVDIDIRCVRMEFFYFPEYRDLPPSQRRLHRRRGQDVCDTLVYHLIVLKRPVSDEKFLQMANDMELLDPPVVAMRRLQEQCERLEVGLREVSDHERQLEAANRELKRCKEELEAANGELAARVGHLDGANGELVQGIGELGQANGELGQANGELGRCKEELEAANRELVAHIGHLEATNGELGRCKGELESANRELFGQRDQLAVANGELVRWKEELEAANRELLGHNGWLEEAHAGLSRTIAGLVDEAARSGEEMGRLRAAVEALSRENASLRDSMSALEAARREQDRQLASITDGAGWRALHAIHRARVAVAPAGTRRGRLMASLWSLPHRAARRGPLAAGKARIDAGKTFGTSASR